MSSAGTQGGAVAPMTGTVEKVSIITGVGKRGLQNDIKIQSSRRSVWFCTTRRELGPKMSSLHNSSQFPIF